MTDKNIEGILNLFGLNDEQKIAAMERGRNIAVTAGAGCGKTLTLVGRYASLLAEGISPRRIAAITFTTKAALEMRSRVRAKLIELQEVAKTEEERQNWINLSAQMDSARIGTLHSLCSEILRAHPAEAGIDPRFDVAQEGSSLALYEQAVTDTLSALVEEEKFIPLFQHVSLFDLNAILHDLLKKRLTAVETFAIQVDNQTLIRGELTSRLKNPLLHDLISSLRDTTDEELISDGGETMAQMIHGLLDLWNDAERSLANGDIFGCTNRLYQARREQMKRAIGKRDGSLKESISDLQANYDQLLDPFIGGKNPKTPPPSPEAETLFEALLPLVQKAFEMVLQTYQDELDRLNTLDFDDLEEKTLQLLRREDIRTKWQGEFDALLVDEFQDTNHRMLEIIKSLAGSPGKLFIVGDMRQSIYRFNQADVTVFKGEQENISREGGLVTELKTTYRAHKPLLNATGDLLSKVIGEISDPCRPYYVPYTPMVAKDQEAKEHLKSPHVELVFGADEDAESARVMAARALASRLQELKKEGQIQKWDDVALLFRARTNFSIYEDALEDAGIPFVTVAGGGFYDRPEIRDILNIMRALADPLDDLAFAGMLRSPAFGLSDVALFQLHQGGQPYWTALQGDLTCLRESEQKLAVRAVETITSLLPYVDRVPVAELLKKVVDAVDYRAILAAVDKKNAQQSTSATGGRLWRNLDKLMEDARTTKQVSVRGFLDVLKTIKDAGAKEGEAPSEAEGAVCIMSIHKAKGLEFNTVVFTEASRQERSKVEKIYLSRELGVSFKLDPPPLLYRLASNIDKDQDDAETLRILYVAFTRAKEKLIVCGHATIDEKGGIRLVSWGEKLAEAAGLDQGDFEKAQGKPTELQTSSGQPIRAWCAMPGFKGEVSERTDTKQDSLVESKLAPLYQRIDDNRNIYDAEDNKLQMDPKQFSSTFEDDYLPGNILGKMVHKAIEVWYFPGDPRLDTLLDTTAFNAGFASAEQRRKSVSHAHELLNRLRQHAVWEEINNAEEKRFEVPYSIVIGGRVEHRIIDLLYRTQKGWHILDFKTDPILSKEHQGELLQKYIPQVRQYRDAVKQLLGVDSSMHICFLDYRGKAELVKVD